MIFHNLFVHPIGLYTAYRVSSNMHDDSSPLLLSNTWQHALLSAWHWHLAFPRCYRIGPLSQSSNSCTYIFASLGSAVRSEKWSDLTVETGKFSVALKSNRCRIKLHRITEAVMDCRCRSATDCMRHALPVEVIQINRSLAF